MSQSRVAQMHAIDHLARLQPCLHPPAAVRRMTGHDLMRPELERTRAILELAEVGLRGRAPDDWLESIERQSGELAERRRHEASPPEFVVGDVQRREQFQSRFGNDKFIIREADHAPASGKLDERFRAILQAGDANLDHLHEIILCEGMSGTNG